MVGITLSPEQIQQAPPEVRRWLEQQVAALFGFSRSEPALRPPEHHLVGCSVADARAILAQIQGLLPAVLVFFELGREPVATSQQGLRALRLDDMLRHSRLQSLDQVADCLEAIDAALQRVRNDPAAALTALDGAGHCLLADATAHSILVLWQEIVAAHGLERPDGAVPETAPPAMPFSVQTPYTVSVPPFSARPPEGAKLAD